MKIELPNAPRLASEGLNLTLNRNLNLPLDGGIKIKSKITIKSRTGARAFSLMEVMIAISIFFAASFIILALVSSGLRTARLLRNERPNCGLLAAEMTLTNTLEEGVETGDFGNLYRDYNWRREITASDSQTGMVNIAFFIYKRGERAPASAMEIQRYDPGMKTKRLGFQP